MAEIRPYTSQILAGGQIGGRSATAGDFGPDTRGLVEGANVAIGGYMKAQEDREISDIQAKMAQARFEWTKEYSRRQNEAEPGDMSFADTLVKDMNTQFETMGGNIKTPRGREVFGRMSENLKTSFGDNAVQFQAGLAGAKAREDAITRSSTNASTIAQDPSQYNAVKAEDEALIKGGVGIYGNLNKVEREKLYRNNVEKYAWAKNYAEIERNPSAWLASAGIDSATTKQNGVPVGAAPSATGRDSAIAFVMKHEGGYNASDGNTGAPVNHGINQKANPDIDVKSLTKEGAVQVYKDRYWSAINGDSLPPAIQATALDAAVNQGPANAKKWLIESGGDPAVFNQLRRAHYDRLAASGQYSPAIVQSWMNRMAASEKASGVGVSAPPLANEETRKQAIARDPSLADLPPEKFFALANHALTRQNQVMAAEREKLNTQLADARASLKLGTDVDIPYAQFKAALGPMADMAYKEYQQDRAFVPWANALHGKSSTEIVDEVNKMKPKGGEGAVNDIRRYGWQREAAQAILEQRKERPTEYVLQQSPYAKRTQEAMDRVLADPQETPERKAAAVQAYAQSVIGEQRRLGMPVSLLTNDQEAQLIASASQARGQDVAAFMRQEAGKWGQYWPEVMKQVGKKMPPSAIVLGQAPEITDDAQALLAEANRVGEKEWKAGLREGDEKDINTRVTQSLDPYWKTLQHKEGGQATYAAWESQAKLLAVGYVRQGYSINDAAKMATQKLVDDVWTLRGSYRVPKSVDANVVERGANAVISRFDNLPLQISQAPAGIRQADWDTIQKAKIKNDMFWVTSDGDTGLTLYRKVGTSSARVPSSTGSAISYTWQELADMAKSSVATGDMNAALASDAPAAERVARVREIERQKAQARQQELLRQAEAVRAK